MNAQKRGFGNRVRSCHKPLPASPAGGWASAIGNLSLLVSNLTILFTGTQKHVSATHQNARSPYCRPHGDHLTGAQLAGVRSAMAVSVSASALRLGHVPPTPRIETLTNDQAVECSFTCYRFKCRERSTSLNYPAFLPTSSTLSSVGSNERCNVAVAAAPTAPTRFNLLPANRKTV